MSENSHPRRRVTYSQLLLLKDYLSKHREIAVGYNKSAQDREHSKQMWEKAALILNSKGDGAVKSGKDWSKYWIDLKAKLKRKRRQVYDSTKTGTCTESLPDLSIKFLEILDNGSNTTGISSDPLESQEQEDPRSDLSSPGSPQSAASEEAECLKLESDDNDDQNYVPLFPTMKPVAFSLEEMETECKPLTVPLIKENSPAPSSSGASIAEEGPNRRQRRRRLKHLTAAKARQQLVAASQARAEAELANSRSLERGVRALVDIASVLKRIETRLSEVVRNKK